MKSLLDLFAGCGGFSLGFHLGGFQTVCAVERDLWASETYKANFPGARVLTADIKTITRKKLYLGRGKINGVIGGPPCQGFSMSGTRDPKDPRNSLFMEFIRLVGETKPDFTVMENVPGLLTMKTRKGQLVSQIISEQFELLGYNSCYHVLNAADYGVPQARNRVFFFGVRDDYPFKSELLRPPPISGGNPVSLSEAISDLPDIESGEGDEEQRYALKPLNDYQRWARRGSSFVQNHVAMRHTKRLQERFAAIGFGQSVTDVADTHGQRKRGNAAELSGKVFGQNNMRPYPDRPCPTVPASFQSNFIHPFKNRNFTAREGARIQSFPDSFVFKGKRTTMSWEKNLSQYQQIGNAVPPLLAKAIADRLNWYFSHLDQVAKHTERRAVARQISMDL